MIEQRTIKATIGCIVAASSSTWFCVGSSGVGNFSAARVEMKTAPTPMGPKCPLKTASLNVLTSGINLYKASMIGRRRSKSTRIAMTIKRQTDSVNSSLENSLKGIHAPINTNAAILKSKSITEENTDCSVWRLKKPSHAKAVPHAKAARRSSLPKRVVTPITNIASETYCAT